MNRHFLLVLALLIVGGAIFVAIYLLRHQIDSWDKVLFVSCMDAFLGALTALAILLFFGQGYARDSGERWFRLAAMALLIGACVTEPFLRMHWNQACYCKPLPPNDRPIDPEGPPPGLTAGDW